MDEFCVILEETFCENKIDIMHIYNMNDQNFRHYKYSE